MMNVSTWNPDFVYIASNSSYVLLHISLETRALIGLPKG